jgi:hypothetical protein
VPRGMVGFLVVLALLDVAANPRLDRARRVVWGVLVLGLFYRDWRTGWDFLDGLPVGAMGYLLIAPGSPGRRGLTSLIVRVRDGRRLEPGSSLERNVRSLPHPVRGRPSS